MIFLYYVLPLIILLMPVLFSAYQYWRQYGGISSVIISIPFWMAVLPVLVYYFSVIIVGGELLLPYAILLLRISLSLFVAILASGAYWMLVKYSRRIILRTPLDRILLSVLTVSNFGYMIVALYIYSVLPVSLAVPWYSILIDIIGALSIIFLIGITIWLTTFLNFREFNRDIAYIGAFFLSFILTIVVSSSFGAPGATLIGYSVLLGMSFVSFLLFLRLVFRAGIPVRELKSVAIIALVLVSLLGITFYPLKDKGSIDESWNCELSFIINVNATQFPIDVDNIRLVDRSLARDFALSYRLPRIGNYQLEVGTEYENIGLIQGKPAWVVPVYYAYAFTPEINYMVGYLYIHLDTPTFESMRFVEKEMVVAPGLYGKKDLFFVALNLIPDGLIGEVYLIDHSPVTSSPAWVVLVDKYTGWGVRIPYKVLIIGSEGDYEIYDWQEAVGIVPQVVSSYALESIIKRIGMSIRNGEKDYFAQGFIWIPVSQDIQEYLRDEFYHRSHHFLIGDWWGRDFYLAVRTTGGEESVAAWILVNSTLMLFDLRFYRGIGGIERGVNAPENALQAMEGIIEGKVPYGAEVRYPKLYRVSIDDKNYLVWVALVVQKLPGADKPIGVVWVDTSNTRIAGFVQYVYGESHDVFMSRLHNNIIASYMGWQGGNETTLVTALINGSIIRKNWALLQPENQYAVIMNIMNTSGEMVTVIVLENKVATKQDFYNAVVAKEGDWVEIEARWDIDLQAWVAYTVKLYL